MQPDRHWPLKDYKFPSKARVLFQFQVFYIEKFKSGTIQADPSVLLGKIL